MSFAVLAGSDVLRGRVTFRLIGAWDAELVVATTDASTLTGTVTLDLGGLLHVGTVTVAEADEGGLVTVRLVGGRGGLDEAVPPLAYRTTTAQAVLADALGLGGESLAVDGDTATLGASLPRWTRTAGDVGGSVAAVARDLGVSWRMTSAGAVWVGPESWAPVEVDHTVEAEDLTNSTIRVAVEDVTLKPGATWAGRRVSQVVYLLDDTKLRADVSYGDTRDELAALLAKLVQRETAGRDLEATYTARVLGQNADGTLELRPNDARIPQLSAVPCRFGVPGVEAMQIASGIDVLVEFENGSGKAPIVTGFPSGSSLKLSISSTDLRLGGDAASDFVALSSRVTAALNAIQVWAQAHVHTCSAPSSPSSTSTVPLSMSTDVAATRVKAL